MEANKPQTVTGSTEYKCPCCGAGIRFGAGEQKMVCEYCDNEFELEAAKEFRDAMSRTESREVVWEEPACGEWEEGEQESLRAFTCPSCGGEIMSDENTAATFCPYCESPAVLNGRVSGTIKPDGVIPFKKTKEEAKAALLKMCKNKFLLPKDFASEQRLEKITGMYVPFWLYDCEGDLDGTYRATRVKRWSDSSYNYTKTDHYLLSRKASASFKGIPLDASSKADNAVMESIEPFGYDAMVDFDTAYLSGYLADKYDVEAKLGEARIKERVDKSMDELLKPTFSSFTSVIPNAKQIKADHGKTSYVLLPVWMLHTKYKDKTYIYAMNGQTGKITGTLPICKSKAIAFFAGITSVISVVLTAAQLLFA